MLSSSNSGSNEAPQSGNLVIGASAAPANQIASGVAEFSITMPPDPYKEVMEVFRITLETDDECVWLGRDLSLGVIPANGGMLQRCRRLRNLSWRIGGGEPFWITGKL